MMVAPDLIVNNDKGGKSSSKKNHSKASSSSGHADSTGYTFEQYYGDAQTHEQFAVGGSSQRTDARQYVQDWDQAWQAASSAGGGKKEKKGKGKEKRDK
ncbi:hypothetical protein DL764_005650 [Monosporascus ibericus]|uniref:Uncharacterized protein n=1 Tax=Monosporascus ibericus TaxID=155417 RepID=A0A4Q4TBD2_9PEZI|nr:hypothetical protein DL764_005650 [Monosporascus ibericus]